LGIALKSNLTIFLQVPLQALVQLLLLEAVQMGVALRKALGQVCQPFCISWQPH
jgi:hypothetical protein